MNANVINIPEWFVKARMKLVAKNNNTHEDKNYRPIACENIKPGFHKANFNHNYGTPFAQ